MIEKVKKNILISLGLGALFYLIISFYADYDAVLKAFGRFNWLLFPLLLILSFSNYFTRFLKWHYYIKLLNIKLSFGDSFAIFMIGLIMSVTPGKFGELLKSYMVKEKTGVQLSRTIPIVFTERITDFISVVILALSGALFFNYEIVLLSVVGIFFLVVVYVISNRNLSLKLLLFLGKIKFLSKYIPKLTEAYESSYTMLKMKPLVLMTLLSIVAWSFECFGFYIILVNFDVLISVFWATFVYGFATIAGSITMLPAGLGVTDGSLTFFIIEKGYSSDVAVAATFIVRAVTLWFAVLVGVLSVFIFKNRFSESLKKNDSYLNEKDFQKNDSTSTEEE